MPNMYKEALHQCEADLNVNDAVLSTNETNEITPLFVVLVVCLPLLAFLVVIFCCISIYRRTRKPVRRPKEHSAISFAQATNSRRRVPERPRPRRDSSDLEDYEIPAISTAKGGVIPSPRGYTGSERPPRSRSRRRGKRRPEQSAYT